MRAQIGGTDEVADWCHHARKSCMRNPVLGLRPLIAAVRAPHRIILGHGQDPDCLAVDRVELVGFPRLARAPYLSGPAIPTV